MNFANPNPHTRFEINLQRTPRWLNLATVILCMITLIGCLLLWFHEHPEDLSMPRIQMQQVPNVSAEIQNKVDDTVKKVVKQ